MALRAKLRLAFASFLVVGTGCTALIGVNDIFLDENAGADGGPESSTVDAPSGNDAGGDAVACTADLQTSKEHCGRCGHDCLGGDCTAGVCQPTTLLNAQLLPTDFAFDDTSVYMASDDTITRVGKDGTGNTVLVSGWDSISGVAVGGGRLFWDAYDDAGDAASGSSFGGLWSCTLPACSDRKRISDAAYGQRLAARDGYVYFASESDLRRIRFDGTGEQTLLTVNRTFSIAVDATHVYLESSAFTLKRVPLDGGTAEDLGPVGAFSGHVAVDDQRTFWTYYDDDTAMYRGYVLSTPKATPGNRTTYGADNFASIGIASDGTTMFWANSGTFTGQTSNGDGKILACPVAGCAGAPVVLAEKLLSTSTLRVDGNAVYFVEIGSGGASGRFLRVAKP